MCVKRVVDGLLAGEPLDVLVLLHGLETDATRTNTLVEFKVGHRAWRGRCHELHGGDECQHTHTFVVVTATNSVPHGALHVRKLVLGIYTTKTPIPAGAPAAQANDVGGTFAQTGPHVTDGHQHENTDHHDEDPGWYAVIFCHGFRLVELVHLW